VPTENRVSILLPIHQGYENIEGDCGLCGTVLTVNRATDLGNASFAGGRFVVCSACGASLRIGGDTGNHPIDLILFDIEFLRSERRYMQGITALAQVLELTLYECARFVFIYRPVRRARRRSATEEIAALLAEFERRTANMTLQPFTNLLCNIAVDRISPISLRKALEAVETINIIAKTTPSDERVSSIRRSELRLAVSALKAATIGTIRNDVSHHLGVRPTQQVFEEQYEQVDQLVRKLLKVFGLTPKGGQLVVGPAV
jgi:hypothetical protein